MLRTKRDAADMLVESSTMLTAIH
jgi:fused-like protein